MAERTISICPIAQGTSLNQIQQEFQHFHIERVALVLEKATAYVQFADANDIEAMGNQYPDCRVAALANAEIGFVEQDFKWPLAKSTARAESLVLIRNCERIASTSEEKIRQIFKKFGIEKVVKFESSEEVVLEFHNQDDLELLDMNFDGLRVPELGANAEIDVETQFPVQRFIEKYLELNQVRVFETTEQVKQSTSAQPKIEQPSEATKYESEEAKIDNYLRAKEEQRKRKEEENKRKMEAMQREIQEAERLRKQSIDAFEKQKREKEEKERQERELRERIQREEREKREAVIRQKEAEQQKARVEAERRTKEQHEQELRQLQRQKTEQQLQEESEQQLIQQRIAAAKKEVEEVERKLSASVEQVQPELERILTEEKELRNQKEIKLPEIIKINATHEQKIAPPSPLPNPQSVSAARKPFIRHDYSNISTHFLTLAILSWIYYLLVR